MAIDPEEMKRRRQHRQAKREKERKKTIIKLIIAGIALVLCAVLIIVFSLSRPDEKPTAQTTETTAPPTTVIRLAAVGDLNVTQSVVDSGGSDANYTETFLDVAHLIADADISVMNFEGNLYGAPYGADRSAPQSMAQALKAAGMDLVQLANSYSIYKGMDGLSATIAGIRNAGMEPLGVYASTDEAKAGKGYTIRTVEGVKIAFVSFTKGMDGMALPPGNENCVNVLYKDYATTYQEVDTEKITGILENVKKEKPDLTVAMLHWGSEFNDTISASQKEICTLLQENGVDAIIGTHSHYVQQMTLDPDTGNFIAYSLGDFIGDAARSGSEYSVVLELEITKNTDSGKTKITGFQYTPIFTVAEKDRPLQVVRIQEAIAAYEAGYIEKVSPETYEAMKYALTRIEARIDGE